MIRVTIMDMTTMVTTNNTQTKMINNTMETATVTTLSIILSMKMNIAGMGTTTKTGKRTLKCISDHIFVLLKIVFGYHLNLTYSFYSYSNYDYVDYPVHQYSSSPFLRSLQKIIQIARNGKKIDI